LNEFSSLTNRCLAFVDTANHATLAKHSFEHEVNLASQVNIIVYCVGAKIYVLFIIISLKFALLVDGSSATQYGFLGSVDANHNESLLGWDTDLFPTDAYMTAQVMLVRDADRVDERLIALVTC
jgi:xylose isomerase